MIQVRNVPDRLHRELKRRAKVRGQTLTDYIQGILEREVAKPDRRALLARILRREPVDLGDIVVSVERAIERNQIPALAEMDEKELPEPTVEEGAEAPAPSLALVDEDYVREHL